MIRVHITYTIRCFHFSDEGHQCPAAIMEEKAAEGVYPIDLVEVDDPHTEGKLLRSLAEQKATALGWGALGTPYGVRYWCPKHIPKATP